MMTIDDALDSINADLMAKCHTLGQTSAAELVGVLALLIAQMPRDRFDALLHERRRRIADGTAFEPGRRKAAIDGAYRSVGKKRRIGYGVSVRRSMR